MKRIIVCLLGVFFAFLLMSCISTKSATSGTVNLQEWEITSTTKGSITKYFINGSSPGPLLRAKMGETLQVRVKNNTQKDVSIHWHGLMVPNDQDGVPGITGPAIAKGTEFTYEFPVVQSGTYWYHAHSMQEAEGLYGGIVFEDPKSFDGPTVMFAGDLGKSPEAVLAGLTKEMGKPQDHSAHHDMHSMHMGQGNAAMPMHGMNMGGGHGMMMHYSDISYAGHLVNGSSTPLVIESNEREVRLRLVNAYVDGFLNLVYSGGKFQVIGTDGLPVKPFSTDHLPIAMGETYDIILPLKEGKKSELVAFFMGEDKVFSKVIVGNGELEELPSLDYKAYSYDAIVPLLETQLPRFVNTKGAGENKEYNIEILGDHEKYNWSLSSNGERLTNISAKMGDTLTFVVRNKTMMPHPMHLHGHFFKVETPKGKRLYKHTLNIAPEESVKIQIVLDGEGKWLYHCHNLFHMARGLSLIIDVQPL